ncbi:MAG: hypothetical protein AAF988_00705, partial [Pseudomonadota bacterium]
MTVRRLENHISLDSITANSDSPYQEEKLVSLGCFASFAALPVVLLLQTFSASSNVSQPPSLFEEQTVDSLFRATPPQNTVDNIPR